LHQLVKNFKLRKDKNKEEAEEEQKHKQMSEIIMGQEEFISRLEEKLHRIMQENVMNCKNTKNLIICMKLALLMLMGI
jgi:succinate dehydrogenase/fumarate reductase flavoprotein subunit